MINRIKNRLASEQGFTLIELLVVIVILGILVAIAVPAYLSFTGNAHTAAAESNVRSAVPAAEDYYETNSSYTGMTGAGLIALAPGVVVGHVVVATNGNSYCIDDTSGTANYYYIGGADAGTPPATYTGGAVTSGLCPSTLT